MYGHRPIVGTISKKERAEADREALKAGVFILGFLAFVVYLLFAIDVEAQTPPHPLPSSVPDSLGVRVPGADLDLSRSRGRMGHPVARQESIDVDPMNAAMEMLRLEQGFTTDGRQLNFRDLVGLEVYFSEFHPLDDFYGASRKTLGGTVEVFDLEWYQGMEGTSATLKLFFAQSIEINLSTTPGQLLYLRARANSVYAGTHWYAVVYNDHTDRVNEVRVNVELIPHR